MHFDNSLDCKFCNSKTVLVIGLSLHLQQWPAHSRHSKIFKEEIVLFFEYAFFPFSQRLISGKKKRMLFTLISFLHILYLGKFLSFKLQLKFLLFLKGNKPFLLELLIIDGLLKLEELKPNTNLTPSKSQS